jgi:hypothetical protein
MSIHNPVIVVPGITASSLRDAYQLDAETVWGAMRRDELRVALHPDDLRYELMEPARVEADGVFRLLYGSLVEELRTELGAPGAVTPVYPFAYDWRQPLALTAARLGAFIEEVIGRTSLLRHYRRAGYHEAPRVDVVAHSMGGLVLAGYLADARGTARVNRVVTIATPFRGSLEAPIRVVTGTAQLGEVEPPNPRDRFAARLTPALYHLLPDFHGAIPGDDGVSTDLFDAAAWQPSVTASIADAIALYGPAPAASRAARESAAHAVLQGMLDDAATFRRRMEKLSLQAAGLADDSWLCIIGVDETTRVRLPIRSEKGRPWLELRSRDRMNAWLQPDDELRVLTGDGTVPFRGAVPPFLPLNRLVCLRPSDFGYWEIRDRALRSAAGFHGTLPTMNLVHRLTAAFLLDDPRRRGIAAWRPPGVTSAAWAPPISGLPERG